jgi:hypothetical protein
VSLFLPKVPAVPLITASRLTDPHIFIDPDIGSI